MYQIKEFILFIVLVFLFLTAILAPISAFVDYMNQRACFHYERISGKKTEYVHFDSCYVEGRRWSEHLIAQTAKDGLK